MAKLRKLKNPPITEAVIDLFVKLPPEVDLDRLQSVQEPVKEDYPQVQKRIFFEQQIRLKKGASAVVPIQERLDGFLFRSGGDGTRVFQARLDGFTFNQLKPYSSWEKIRDEACRLWTVYVKRVAPEHVLRVALRYINQIEVTLPVKRFTDILTSAIPVPREFTQASGFLTRVAVPDTDSPAIATVTQLFDPTPGSTSAKLILDIEAGYNPNSPMKPEEAWGMLEKMRNLKNRCFFGSVTDKALEPFL